jgi:hypothetical protein
MRRKDIYTMLIVVAMIAFLASCQITKTEPTTVDTADALVWLYFPDLEERPYEIIVLTGDDLDEALCYLNGIEFKDANGQPEEPLTEMYVAVDAVRGYTMTYLVDSIGQVWAYIDEDCLWVGVPIHAKMKGGKE